MTLNGAIMQLAEMCENSMMPGLFKPYFDKVIETISECVEPSEIPHWIPVSERLPEVGGWFIVTKDGAGGDKHVFLSYFSTAHGWEFAEEPVAWMPLPEPYTEDET